VSFDAVRAQALRRRVRIERKVSVRDSYGGEAVSYALRAEVNAEVKPVSGREPLVGQQFVEGEQYEFVIRYRDDVTLTDRVVWKGKNFDVQALLELGRNRRLRITAKRPGGEAT
jgi:SPP1 family predicted phage head-tail adaptor